MLDGTPLLDYANKGIEDIAVNMGVVHPEFSARYDNEKAAAITFLQLLDEMDCSPEDKQEEYKKQLASLLKPFADNPAYQAFLELEYVAKTGEKL